MVGVVARQGADAVWAEELLLIEHPRQDPTQLGLVHGGQHPPPVHPRDAGVMDGGEQLGHGIDPPAQPLLQVIADGRALQREDARGADRQQAHHRAHLEALRLAVGEA